MAHTRVPALLALITVTVVFHAQPVTAADPVPVGAVGGTVRPFTVRQPDGGTVMLPGHSKDAKAVVVVLVAFDCPIAKSCSAPLGDKEYTASRAMPPWRPAGGPEYLHDRRMPKAEIELLGAWVDAQEGRGDFKPKPTPKTLRPIPVFGLQPRPYFGEGFVQRIPASLLF